MQVCISLQTDNHASTPTLKFFTGRMPFLPPNQQRQSTEGTRRYASAIYMLSVCLSVCHKPVLYPNDCTNRAGFWRGRGGFLPPAPHCVIRKSGYLQKLGYLPPVLCPKLRTLKISPRQVDRVNDTRRRRSSLLTTPIRQSTSRGCLLQVGQL